MTRIDRWLWTRHLQLFGGTLGVLCLLYLVIDFADRSQAYTGAGWLRWVADLYACRAFAIAALLAPIASLIACGLTVSALRRQSEWVALVAAGLSPLRLIRPLLGSALAIGVGTAVFNDQVAVRAALRAERITAEHFHLWGAYAAYFQPKRWIRSGSSIVHFGQPRPGGGANDVSILELSPDFTLNRRVDARAAIVKEDGTFELQQAEVRTFDGLRQHLEAVERMAVDLPGAQALFGLAPGRPEMLSVAELSHQVVARDRLGLASGEQRYEIAARYADILAGVAGALAAAALALRPRRRGHVNVTLVEGIATAGALWGLSAVFKSLSLSEVAPPAVCALSPLLLLIALGLASIAVVTGRPAR